MFPELNQLIAYGPTVVLTALLLVFILKALPTWKEVKIEGIKQQGKDTEARVAQATALGQLASAQSGLAQVLHTVAVEQRRATESVEIMQRVNADSADKLSVNVERLNERIVTHDVQLQQQQSLAERVKVLEDNAYQGTSPR